MSPFIVSLAIRLTILLLAGGLVAVAVRRSTYAMRHVVIAATLACVVALPAVMAMVPEWRVKVLPSSPTMDAIVTSTASSLETPATVTTQASIHPILLTSQNEPSASASTAAATGVSTIEAPSLAQRARALSAPQIVLAVWLLGVFFGLAWIAAGRLGLARVRRGATPLRSYEWRTLLEAEAMHAGVARRVGLFTSPSVSMPVTWGVLSPVIVLPEASLAWTHDRKRVVIMHEMAHIARRDSATQLVATFACVAYWLHPLVLLAARRLRAECERACDERVLERGTPAAEYAAHLLDVARFSRSFGAASIVSVAMARPSQLEGRLLAVLRAEPRNTRTSAPVRATAAICAAVMLMAISAFRPVAREAEVRVTTVRTSLQAASVIQLPTVRVPATPNIARVASVTAAVVVAPASPAPIAALVAPAMPVHTKPDSTFQKSVPVHADGTLELDLDTGGDIEIVGSDDGKVVVDGALGGRSWRETTVELEGKGGDARLESRYIGSSNVQMFNNSFKIKVPKKFNVRITSSGGNVSISGVDGHFFGSTGGGKIDIDHATGEANISTGGGDVRVSSSHLDGSVATGGGEVNFEDVTGSIAGGSGSSMRMKGGFAYAWPKFPKMPAMAEFDGAQMERSRKEMEREQAQVEREQGRIERNRAAMERDESYSDSMRGPERAMMRSREAMERAREVMERNRVIMDSARIMIDRNRGAMDTADIVLRKMSPMKIDLGTLKYDVYGMKDDVGPGDEEDADQDRGPEGASRRKKMIVIDKSGGAIRVLTAPNGARLSTGGGSISVGRSLGRVSALTGGGDIDIQEADDDASAVTGSGAITITAGTGEAHAVDVRSGRGDINVMLPRGANVTLDLESAFTENFGRQTKITGDWSLDTTVTPDWDSTQGTPRKYVRVKQKLGKGGPLIRVRTVNGDIKLKAGR